MSFHTNPQYSTLIHTKSTLTKTLPSTSTTTLPYRGVGCGGGKGGVCFHGYNVSTVIPQQVAS